MSLTSPALPCSYSYLAGANGGTTALVSSITYSGKSTAAYTYSYDARGNITAVYKGGTLQASYVYDDLNQLTRENNVTANKTWVYTYDERGNILSKKTYAYTTGTLGTVQNTDSYEYFEQSSSYLWGDGLVRYNGGFNVYDAIGNPTQYENGNTFYFTWENGRQLTSGTKGETTFAYTYNADGLRTKKVVDGVTTEYYWAGSQLAMMVVAPGTSSEKVLKFYYDAEGRPLCLDFNGTVYLYITNLQGDVVAIADEYGEVIRYEYDAWGKPISTYYVASPYYDAMQYNPLRYRGYIYDNETGFYYLQSRYYDPAVGRFINSDGYVSTGQGIFGHNMFAYCNNNPVNRVDPTGEFGLLQFVIIGLAILDVGITTDKNQTYETMDDAAQAWKDKYQAKSENKEYGAIIYEKTNKNGDVSYVLGRTYPGNSKNVIAGFLAGYLPGGMMSVLSSKKRMVGFVHSHPAPDPKGHNDFPSSTDEWLLNLPGIDEVYVIPWRPCRGRTDFIKTTEKSNWYHE